MLLDILYMYALAASEAGTLGLAWFVSSVSWGLKTLSEKVIWVHILSHRDPRNLWNGKQRDTPDDTKA